MKVLEFENKVWDLEDVLIRIRAPLETRIGDYACETRDDDSTTLKQWLNTRIYPNVRKYNESVEVCVIDGNCESPHGKTKLQTIRLSYLRN